MVETLNVILNGGSPKKSNLISAWSPTCQPNARTHNREGQEGKGTFADVFNDVGAFADSDARNFVDVFLHFTDSDECFASTCSISNTDDCQISLLFCDARECGVCSLGDVSFPIECIFDLPWRGPLESI